MSVFCSTGSLDQYSFKEVAMMHPDRCGALLAQAAVACCGSLDMLPTFFPRIVLVQLSQRQKEAILSRSAT